MISNFVNIILITFIFLIKNGDSCKNGIKAFSGVKVSYTIPLINTDGSLTDKKSTYEVYYWGDLMLYNFFYTFDSSYNNELILSEKRNYCFVFHKDSLYGYNYYPYFHTPFPNGRISVDSMLNFNTFKNNKFDSLQYFRPDSSIYKKDGEIVFVYRNVWRERSPEIFCIYLTYSKKMNRVIESFAKKIDTIQDLKLSKIAVVASGGYIKEYNMNMQKREYVYEMTEISKKELEERLKYLKRAKEEYLSRSSAH